MNGFRQRSAGLNQLYQQPTFLNCKSGIKGLNYWINISKNAKITRKYLTNSKTDIGFPQNNICVSISQLYSANVSNQNFKTIISFKENGNTSKLRRRLNGIWNKNSKHQNNIKLREFTYQTHFLQIYLINMFTVVFQVIFFLNMVVWIFKNLKTKSKLL